MDVTTLAAHDAQPDRFSELYRSIDPEPLRRLMLAFFHAGQPTADIGCGSGRDVDWLLQQGFPTVGYDASEGMLRQARSYFPGIVVGQSSLPDLANIPSDEYGNILCAATLMHVGRENLITAILNLARVLRPAPTLAM